MSPAAESFGALRPRRPRVFRRSRGGTSVTGAVVTALVLALAVPLGIVPTGLTPASASWTTTEGTASARVAPGKLTIEESGFAALATSYTSSTLTATAPVSITNTGSIPAPYTLQLGVVTATALSQAFEVHVWSVPTKTACSASSTASGPATDWSTVGALTGTLAPGATSVYCVRATLSQAQRFAQSGTSITAVSVVSAAQGSWRSAKSAAAVLSVADTVTPGVVSKTSETDSSVSLAWTAPSDSVAVTSYQIFRGATLVGTVPATVRQFTDSGLTVSTYHPYTVRAVSAGTPSASSPESPAILHATGWFNTTSGYSIRNVADQLCVAGESGSDSYGEALIATTCSPRADQLWTFVTDGAYVKVSPHSTPGLFWDSPADHSSILRTTSNVSAQKWEVVAIAPGSGTFLLRNRNNLCLDTAGGLTADGHPALRVTDCTSSTAQQFTLQKGA